MQNYFLNHEIQFNTKHAHGRHLKKLYENRKDAYVDFLLKKSTERFTEQVRRARVCHSQFLLPTEKKYIRKWLSEQVYPWLGNFRSLPRVNPNQPVSLSHLMTCITPVTRSNPAPRRRGECADGPLALWYVRAKRAAKRLSDNPDNTYTLDQLMRRVNTAILDINDVINGVIRYTAHSSRCTPSWTLWYVPVAFYAELDSGFVREAVSRCSSSALYHGFHLIGSATWVLWPENGTLPFKKLVAKLGLPAYVAKLYASDEFIPYEKLFLVCPNRRFDQRYPRILRMPTSVNKTNDSTVQLTTKIVLGAKK